MTKSKFFVKDNESFMRVTPVKSLFHSGLVHDVITKGGEFVVNMNTGELTIHRETSTSVDLKRKLVEALNREPDKQLKIMLKLKDDDDIILLSLNPTQAFSYLLDNYSVSNLRHCLVYSNRITKPLGFPIDKTLGTFREEFYQFYLRVKKGTVLE
jgi:hypothetical protein